MQTVLRSKVEVEPQEDMEKPPPLPSVTSLPSFLSAGSVAMAASDSSWKKEVAG